MTPGEICRTLYRRHHLEGISVKAIKEVEAKYMPGQAYTSYRDLRCADVPYFVADILALTPE